MRTNRFLIVVSILISSSIAAHSFDAEQAKSLIETHRQEWEIPGMAVAIVHQGETLLLDGFGVKNIGKSDLIDVETQFAIASNSKTFTCAALAMAVDDGLLNWDDPVIDYLPTFRLSDPYRTLDMTIRDLVTHKTGMEGGNPAWWRTEFTRKELLSRLKYLEVSQKFRSGYYYNNLMYFTAGMVLESASGMSWDDFIQTRIFDPLGMKNSSSSIHGFDEKSNIAVPHAFHRGDDKIEPTEWYDANHVGAAASISSSAVDMATWMKFLLAKGKFGDQQLISETQIEEMQSPQTILSTQSINDIGRHVNFHAYGMGHRMYEYKGLKYVEHGGHVVTFRSHVCLIPELELGVTVLTNSETDCCEAMCYALCDLFLEQDGPDWLDIYLKKHREWRSNIKKETEKRTEERIADAPASRPLEDYAGEYTHPMYGSFYLEAKNGSLNFNFNQTHLFKGKLKHWHYDTFLLLPDLQFRDEALVSFQLDTSGAISSVKILGAVYEKKE
ncbi:MAG: serine hydrolase [Candidatus Hinthialibacter antarcticus]|nr:serine hydrolase [Candidatus Hinthialibacter antarcticus]